MIKSYSANLKEVSMFIYEGVNCPYCGRPLTEKDDIAVCPECGTPHHRDCYREHGECANTSLHSDTFEWKRPEPERPQNDTEYVCTRCGAHISREDAVCPNCGEPVPQLLPRSEAGASPDDGRQESGRSYTPEGNIYGFGPSDTIDGVTLRDLSEYLKNPSYIIAICRQQLSGRKIVFSLPALFSPSLFFLYNKVWGEGLLAMFLSMLLSIPDGMVIYYRMTSSTLFGIPLTTWDSLSSACSIISILVNLFFAFFGMEILKRNAVKKIKKIRSMSRNEQEYRILLQKYSPPSKLVMVLIGLYIAMLLFSMFFV